MSTLPSDYDDAAPGSRPTMIRHAVVFVAMLMSVLLYLDRFCVSFAEVYIQEDLRLTKSQMAYFFSTFFFAYALAQVPSGWLSDRFGSRIMMSIYVLAWSVFTALTGFANGLVFLLLMRVGFGIGQAGAYPTSASLLSKWVPFQSRGTASSIVALGGRLGGAIAPILTAYLMVLFVPLGTSSLLNERSFLPGKMQVFCEKLVVGSKETPSSSNEAASPAAHVWNLLPEESHDSVKRIANSKKPTELTHDREKVIAGLNTELSDVAFYDATVFNKIVPAREGFQMMARVKEGEKLSQAELERMNRLILEKAFPEEIGKIYVAGWRPVMSIYGLSGIAIAALIWLVFRNRPDVHPWCNDAERKLIASGRPAGAPSPHGRPGAIPWMRLLSSVSLWLDSIAQVGTNIGWVFLVTFLARYLDEVHHVEIITRSWMTSIPMFAGIAGLYFGGPLTDILTRTVGLRWGRSLPVALTRYVAAAAYISCLWINDPWVATILFAGVAFFCDLGIAPIWAFKQDAGGRYVGSILGWGNMWGNLAASIATPLYVFVLTDTPTISNWNNMFLMCAGAFFMAGTAALGINATIPIAPPDEDEEEEDLATANT